MKAIKICLSIFLLMSFFSVINAQDVITKKDGSEIKAKVTEIGDKEVKYKNFGNESGPTYTISKSELFMIKYENGEKDIFNNTATQPQTSAAQAVVEPQQATVQSGNQQKAAAVGAPSEPVVRKGYVGISFGGTFLTKQYSNISSGGVFGLNFGYLFNKNVGITSSIFGTSYALSNYNNTTIGVGGLLVGPLISTEVIPQTIELDARPTIGFGSLSATYNGSSATSKETGFIFGLGGSARWNCSKRVSLSGNLDYYNCNVSGIDLSSFAISVGVNIRF